MSSHNHTSGNSNEIGILFLLSKTKRAKWNDEN